MKHNETCNKNPSQKLALFTTKMATTPAKTEKMNYVKDSSIGTNLKSKPRGVGLIKVGNLGSNLLSAFNSCEANSHRTFHTLNEPQLVNVENGVPG